MFELGNDFENKIDHLDLDGFLLFYGKSLSLWWLKIWVKLNLIIYINYFYILFESMRSNVNR